MLKEQIANQMIKIAKTLSNEQKKHMIEAFTAKNKDKSDYEANLAQLKELINYKGE